MKTSGNTILMTGGGSGIGEALAHRFHDRGDTVIVAGRRREALEAAAAGRRRIYPVSVDLEDAAAVDQFAKHLAVDFPNLNVLFNNAGVMAYEGLAKRRDLFDAERTLATNLLAPMRLTNALVDHLRRRPDATIVNVTSALAFVPMVAAPTYSASKSAMHSYTVSLRAQLAGSVEVVELVPPGVRTDIAPGQRERRDYMPLEDFADAVMAIVGRNPLPKEILVEEVLAFRTAERDGRFDAVLAALTETSARAHEAEAR